VPRPRHDHESRKPSHHNDGARGRRALPDPARIAELPGIRATVRYQAAGGSSGAGGDWYLATPLPDGRVFLAIGDVAGHGPVVAPRMLHLSRALATLATTGEPAGRLLDWLGGVVQASGTEHTASALAGYFDPATLTFSWAQAGHPPPVLVRDGAVSAITRPAGVLLGAPAAGYETAVTALLPSDIVLFYTDGLFERRDLLLEAGAMRAFGAALGQPDLEAAASAVITAAGPNPGDDTCLLAIQVS
jgi:serine phosphatase RsbU (regulator of sigma subunit)